MFKTKKNKSGYSLLLLFSFSFSSLAVLSFLFFQHFLSCGKFSKNAQKEEQTGEVMIRVGDTTITIQDFRSFLDSLPELKKIEIMRSPENMTKAVAEFVEALALFKYAEQKGYFNRPDLKIRRIIVLADLVRPFVFENEIKPYSTVDFTEIQKFYEENKELFKHPEVVRLMKIESKSKEELVELRRKINNVQDFVNIAQTRSLPHEFDLGYVAKGDLPKEIADLVFSMKKGEISNPTKYKDGYAIFAVVDKLEEGYWPLEGVVDKVFRAVREKKIRDRISDITKNFIMESDIFVNFDAIEREFKVKLSREKFEELFMQKIR